ncbi:hypothetical protein TNCV_4676601 [Trichonephila clavipes]|nr:hypothetical protein TNCV_4676601 [Trichonephila clavipes]
MRHLNIQSEIRAMMSNAFSLACLHSHTGHDGFALKAFASDPKCVVNNSSEIQLASVRHFVVIHFISRASSPRISELPVYFKERPASDPKCVVIHSKLAEELGLIDEASLTKTQAKESHREKAQITSKMMSKIIIDSIVKDRIRKEEKRREIAARI